MGVLVCLSYDTIEKVSEIFMQYGTLVDYDKESDMALNDKIVLGKVAKVYPFYRRNNFSSEEDCLVLQLQKVIPVERLLEEPRVFRVLCQGTIAVKLSHIEENSYLAFKNPKSFLVHSSPEPNFIIDKTTPIIWELPHLKLLEHSKMPISGTNDSQKSPPVNEENAPRLSSLDGDKSLSCSLGIGDRNQVCSNVPDVNEKEVSETEEENDHVKPKTCFEDLKLNPVESHMNSEPTEFCISNNRKKIEHLNAAERNCDCRKIDCAFEKCLSNDSYIGRNVERENCFMPLKDTNRDKKGSSNYHECCELSTNSLPKTVHNHECCESYYNTQPKDNVRPHSCLENFKLSPIKLYTDLCTNNRKKIENLNAAENTCDSRKSGCSCEKSLSHNSYYRTNVGKEKCYMPTYVKNNMCTKNQCCAHYQQNNTDGDKVIYYVVDSTNFRGCDIHRATSMINNYASANQCKACRIHPSDIVHDQTRHAIQSMNSCNHTVHRHGAEEYDRYSRTNHYPCENRISTPVHKIGSNSRSPELGHNKRRLGRNNRGSPEHDHGTHKLERNNSNLLKRGRLQHKSDRNNSMSPERDHLKNKKMKRLYNNNTNLSDVLIGDSSSIDYVAPEGEKESCKLSCEKQGQDSLKTEEKLHSLSCKNSKSNTVEENQNNKIKFQFSSAEEKRPEDSNSSPRKQYKIQLKFLKSKNGLNSGDENLPDNLKKLKNNSNSVQEVSGNNLMEKHGDVTITPATVETNLPNKINETESNSVVIEKPKENLLEMKTINSSEEKINKSHLSDGGSCNSWDTATLDLHDLSTVEGGPQPSEIISQPYYDAEEKTTDGISPQVTECLDIMKTLSEQSLCSFKELFSAENDDFREDFLLKLRNFKKKAQITAVVVDMCPDIRLDPLSIVKGTCLSGCRQSFYINTIAHKTVKKPKCKCCRLITHYVCPSCSERNGKLNLMCLSFCFDLHVLYGQNVLFIAVNGNSAERFLGCSLRNYLSYSAISLNVVSIMEKIIINTPPEDWKNAVLLKLNVKSTEISNGKIILRLVNTDLGDSLIRRGCFISKEQL